MLNFILAIFGSLIRRIGSGSRKPFPDCPFGTAGGWLCGHSTTGCPGLALQALGRDGERRGVSFLGALGESSLSRRNKGHRRKMDEALRGEFSKVLGLAEKWGALTGTLGFRGEWRLAPQAKVSSEYQGGIHVRFQLLDNPLT